MLLAVNTAVQGRKMPPASSPPRADAVGRLVALLDQISAWAEEIAPVEQPQRFGNKAFRTFYQRLEEVCDHMRGRGAAGPDCERSVPRLVGAAQLECFFMQLTSCLVESGIKLVVCR